MCHLFPVPKSYMIRQGTLSLDHTPQLQIHPLIKEACISRGYEPKAALLHLFHSTGAGPLPVRIDHARLHPEGFTLRITSSAIHIRCSTGAGLFYGINALTQLAAQRGDSLPCAEIEDYPSLDTRGILLDIGRDKIPSMGTLYGLLDLFSAMRINHMQMYMEGFCFQYEPYQYLFANETPVTPEEFKKLSAYAKARFIDLVPNQNVLGHMEKWLEKPQFRHLAECEEGYVFENLYQRPPMTLDVRDEESIRLAKTLLDPLLDHSDSDYVNVNMDEPFELGMGKNREAAEAKGRMSLYFEYLEKLHTYCRERGKKMMMWGDEVLHHPECVARFPKDVTLLDWIYEGEADFTSHAQLMEQTGLSFCLCPGTSAWGSLTGRCDNMKKNIQNAAETALEYGGKGIITTDWGDLGHWQYVSVSYPGYAFTASCSWSGRQANDRIVSWYCNRFIYQSPDCSAFKAAWDLGNYYHFERAPLYNTTLAFAVMSAKYPFESIGEFDEKMDRLLKLSANIAKTNRIPEKEAVIAIDYEAMADWLGQVEKEIDAATLLAPDGLLIKEEMKNGLRMVRHGVRLYQAMKVMRGEDLSFKKEMEALFEDLDEIMKVHFRLWRARNRTGGFERSSRHLVHLLDFYRKMAKSKE